jgi:enoyl-CoA hydratase/carnithine racemase
MSAFESYADRFATIRMSRSDGILEMQLHTNGEELQWGVVPHDELAAAFRAVAQDRANTVVILTGTGTAFSGPRPSERDAHLHAMSARAWEERHATGTELMDSLLSIEALVIAAVNGPAVRHCEIPLMSDIVLCSEDAEFQDSAHFSNGLTPGDGINVVTTMVMGATRARYFHLTGQVIDAALALDWGIVNEVVPRERLLGRARELARQLAKQKPMVVRHTRLLHTLEMRKRMLDLVGYGLALEGLDVVDARDAAVAGHLSRGAAS